jgi:hypothetical protein
MGTLSAVVAAALFCGAGNPPLTDEQAGQVADRMGASARQRGEVYFNFVLGMGAARLDPALMKAMEARLDHPAAMENLTGAVAAARGLRAPALVPALMRVAEREGVDPRVRVNAAKAAGLCDPQSELPGQWALRLAGQRAFVPWKPEEQGAFLWATLELLPPGEVVDLCDSLLRWADDLHLGRSSRFWASAEHTRKYAKWCVDVENMPEDEQTKAIVDSALIWGPVLRLARHPVRHDRVVAELRRRDPGGEEKQVVKLLDDLGVILTEDEKFRLTVMCLGG